MENQNQSIFIKYNKNKELIGTVSEIPYFNNFIMKIKDQYFKMSDSLPEIRLQYEDDDKDLCMLQNQEDYDIMIEMEGPYSIKMALENEASLSSNVQDSFIHLEKQEEILQTQQQKPKLEINQNITDEESQRKMSMENFDDIDSQEIEKIQNDLQEENNNSALSQENIEMQNENEEIQQNVEQEFSGVDQDIQKDVQEEKSVLNLNQDQVIQKDVIKNEKMEPYIPKSDESIMRVIASVPEQEKDNHLEDLYNKIKEESLMKKEQILKDEVQDQNEISEEEKIDNVNELLDDALNQDPSQMMVQNIAEQIRKSAFHIENSLDPLGEIQILINTLQQQHKALKIEKDKLQQNQQKDNEWWVLKGAKDIFSSINPFQKPQMSQIQKQKIFKQKFNLLKEIYQFDNGWNADVEKFVNANITVSDSQLAEGYIAHLKPTLEKKDKQMLLKQKI